MHNNTYQYHLKNIKAVKCGKSMQVYYYDYIKIFLCLVLLID